MAMQSLGGPTNLPQISPPTAREAKSTAGNVPFSELVEGLVKQTNEQTQQAQQSVEQLVTGEATSLHDVVLTASRADLAFRLMMEIRNRLISSYQEVMRMQV